MKFNTQLFLSLVLPAAVAAKSPFGGPIAAFSMNNPNAPKEISPQAAEDVFNSAAGAQAPYSNTPISPSPNTPKKREGMFLTGGTEQPGLVTPAGMLPVYPTLETVQGGGTIRTYKMPPWAERCQMLIMTNGRPLKAMGQLWLGPLRSTHTIKIDSQDGLETPYQATLKFKKESQMLRLSSNDSLEFPFMCGVYVPSPARSKELGAMTQAVWDTAIAEKQTIQGGSVNGGGGAIRYWSIPESVNSVQVLAWAKDTGKKSFKADFHVIQGPNNKKQNYFLQCGGGSQPYHGVIQTPGEGCVIGVQNKKFLEDGLVQFAIVPYDVDTEWEDTDTVIKPSFEYK